MGVYILLGIDYEVKSQRRVASRELTNEELLLASGGAHKLRMSFRRIIITFSFEASSTRGGAAARASPAALAHFAERRWIGSASCRAEFQSPVSRSDMVGHPASLRPLRLNICHDLP